MSEPLKIDLPPLSAVYGNYDPVAHAAKYAANRDLIKEKYHFEKWVGKRRENGLLNIVETLKPVHKRIISAHINGMKGVEIAEQFNLSVITVYRILGDPLSRSLIDEFTDNFKSEFKAMFPLVSDAIRDGLSEDRAFGTRMKAVDRFIKVHKMIDGVDDTDSTEGKVAEVSSARIRIVQTIKDALAKTETVTMIEAVIDEEVVVVDA